MSPTLVADDATTAGIAGHRDATKSPPLSRTWTHAVADHVAGVRVLAENLRADAQRTSVTIIFVAPAENTWERNQVARFAHTSPLQGPTSWLNCPQPYDWRKRVEEIEQLTARGRFRVTANALNLAQQLARYVEFRCLSEGKSIPTVIIPLDDGGVQAQWTARELPLWRHVEVEIPATVRVPMDEFSRLTVLRTTEEPEGRIVSERTTTVTSRAELLAAIEWVLVGPAR